MARNPAVMQEMMRNQDRALSNLEVISQLHCCYPISCFVYVVLSNAVSIKHSHTVCYILLCILFLELARRF
jgi:hypothetical protein